MINFDDAAKENIKQISPNWPRIPYHPYRTLIIAGSESGKTSSLFSLISDQPDIDKICLYAKYSYESKYQSLLNKRECTDLKQI